MKRKGKRVKSGGRDIASDDYKQICKNVAAIRRMKGLSLTDVSDVIGTHRATYSKLERGIRAFTLHDFLIISNVFDMSTDEIINFHQKVNI